MSFFIPGLLVTSWATRTPTIRDQLMLSTAEMGVVLFGLSVGSMNGILCSTWLVKHFSTRKVIRTTMSFAVLDMLVLSLVLWASSAPLFAFGLTIPDTSFGSTEIAINAEGAVTEREMNRTMLPMVYGFYDFGALFGAGVGIVVTGLGLSTVPHVLAATLVAILPITVAIRTIPDGTDKDAAEIAHGEARGLPVWRDARLLLIGVIVLVMAFAEGLVNDRLPLLMVDSHGFSPASGSLIYVGFTLGMTLGHFTDGWFIDHYSRVIVVRGSAVTGTLGIGLIIFVDNPRVVGTSVLLWDISASLGFPLTISAAGDTGSNVPKRVSMVTTTGYLAFLVESPLLGFLGGHFGLYNAMMVVLGLVMVAALVAHAVAKP